MSEVKIYGASDDLIEVEGVIREEFDGGDDLTYLGFSDGTVLSVVYGDDGFWRINRVAVGAAEYDKREATDVDNDYSDEVTLRGSIRWVVAGDRFEIE